MKTKSIIDLLEIKFGYKENYSDEECNQIENLIINRFGFDDQIIEIDFEDLLHFKNLKELTLNQCMIDFKTISIIYLLKNLENLTLLNCDVVGDIYNVFSSLKIKKLTIDNTNIELDVINNLDINELILNNVEINSNINFNTYRLDIRKCKYERLNIENVEKLVISHSQYLEDKEFFDSYKEKLIIMEDNGQFEVSKGKL